MDADLKPLCVNPPPGKAVESSLKMPRMPPCNYFERLRFREGMGKKGLVLLKRSFVLFCSTVYCERLSLEMHFSLPDFCMTIEEQQMSGYSRTIIYVVAFTLVEYDFWLVSWTIPPSGGGRESMTWKC